MFEMQDFSYCLSSELDQFTLRFKILDLQDNRALQKSLKLLEDPFLYKAQGQTQFYIECQPFADNKPLCLPCKTSFKQSINKRGDLEWNEWIIFPIPYSCLPITTQVAITIYEVYSPRHPRAVGGTTFRLFGKHKTIRKGKYKLHIWPDVEADGLSECSTPAKFRGNTESDRLDKLLRKYERGDIQHLDWMDNLVIDQITKYQESLSMQSNETCLFIHLPIFDFPVVFNEKEYCYPENITLRQVNSSLVSVFDADIFQDNIVENKHRKLARSQRTGVLDRELKPNAKIRDELNDLLRYPPTKLMSEQEKDLLWKFRYYLTRDKKALTKFLKCVIWSDPVEAKQAIDLLSAWVSIDVEDALELLSPDFTDPTVRTFGVSQLRRADDEELQLYLLQLVQALKFERLEQRQESSLVQFLIERGIANPILGNSLYWYLMVETEDKVCGKTFAKVVYQFLKIMIETPDGINRRDNLHRQGELVAKLSSLSREFRISKEPRPKKIQKLQLYIADPKNGLLSFPPLSLPLNPHVQVTGIVPEKAGMFKSQLLPLFLTFSCLDGSEYPIIFKTGDDLRQDQLVVQIFSLMDRMLRKENLDLKITPYKVLATGIDHGMVQFVQSRPIASILSEYGNSLHPFLVGPNSDQIDKQTLDIYLRSTAGYCVMTYLLGIGDRHLDNLLLTKDGNLFHIDFGYILGRDPKPYPPPMKICKEMVEVMGGTSSPNYTQFKSYAFIAFNSLRKSSNLILNLFSLMVKANIPDIAIDPERTVLKVQERFQLYLTDEEAIHYFQGLINDTLSSYFPHYFEQIHKVSQFFKS